jgi:galactokinase
MNGFVEAFGTPPAFASEAPGRVNLIGEHTDYNQGFVLPLALPRFCRVYLHPRPDRLVRACSASFPGAPVAYRLGEERPGGTWLDYVQGCTAVLRGSGYEVGGFDLAIASDLPLGAGLSSSAALDVALLRCLRAAFGLPLSDVEIAQMGQRVENEFVGARVGIMDPLAASLGRPWTAMFVDTRELSWRHVPLPPLAELAILDSGVRHQHSAGDYNTRRAECERACALLGIESLRDLGPEDLSRAETLPAPLARRVRHVVTENQRVLQAAAALEAGDLPALGRLFDASHDSQRDDYEVSVPQIELLVALARRHPQAYGARLTGGGFGGSIVVLTRPGGAARLAADVASAYQEQTGHQIAPLVLARSA